MCEHQQSCRGKGWAKPSPVLIISLDNNAEKIKPTHHAWYELIVASCSCRQMPNKTHMYMHSFLKNDLLKNRTVYLKIYGGKISAPSGSYSANIFHLNY